MRFKIGDTVVLSEYAKQTHLKEKEKQDKRVFGKIVGYSYTERCYRVKWNVMKTIEVLHENFLEHSPSEKEAKILKQRVEQVLDKAYKELKRFLEDCESLGKALRNEKIYYLASGLKFTLITNLRELIEMLLNLEKT